MKVWKQIDKVLHSKAKPKVKLHAIDMILVNRRPSGVYAFRYHYELDTEAGNLLEKVLDE